MKSKEETFTVRPIVFCNFHSTEKIKVDILPAALTLFFKKILKNEQKVIAARYSLSQAEPATLTLTFSKQMTSPRA